MPQDLPEGFRALPPDEQQRILRAGDDLGQRVVAHAVKIFIGPSAFAAGSSPAAHASGIRLVHGQDHYLLTALHVVKGYAERQANGHIAVFQVGNVLLPVLRRITWFDEGTDTVIVALEEGEASAIPSTAWRVTSWPPPLLTDEDYVAFAGFPTEYRKDRSPTEIDLNAIGGIVQVASASERRLFSTLDRPNLILTRGDDLPPYDARLGGMSGGPVFKVWEAQIDLVAVITDWHEAYDCFIFGGFGGSILAHTHRVAV